MNAFAKIEESIKLNKSFVLQGGAGSGKTETLKNTLQLITDNYPASNVLCITHTNFAVAQIKARVGDNYTVSTIHSFLNSFIKNYKKNIHAVFPQLFILSHSTRLNPLDFDGDDKALKKAEHNNYKKAHNAYASLLFSIAGDRAEKAIGKRDFDKDPQTYIDDLNSKIDSINAELIEKINNSEYSVIKYNETRFNSLEDLSYGHDGLLEISYLLFKKYPLISKILQDKFNYVFIDEYQDTNQKVIEIFIDFFLHQKNTLVGLFGDSMQAIYDDGIGDVNNYIESGLLERINKEDNYRCSEQIINFINKLRLDDLKQEVAYKLKENGTEESKEDRQGSVALYYSFVDKKPTSRSLQDEKDSYTAKLDQLISKATEEGTTYTQLKLTNKKIADDAGFGSLFNIFSNRYQDHMDYLSKHMDKLQLTELFEIYNAYRPKVGNPNYNLVLSKLKKSGFALKKLADKNEINDKFIQLTSSDRSVLSALNYAFEQNILGQSERHKKYIESKDSFFAQLQTNTLYPNFKTLYLGGKSTFNKIKGDIENIDEEIFDDLRRKVKQDIFYTSLFSEDLMFSEVLNYNYYLEETTPFLTMHKTKGGEIDNVIVVLDEYFWNPYDFSTVFSDDGSLAKKEISQKLSYVACSRAKKNLVCVKLLSSDDEERDLLRYFDQHTKVEL